MNIDLEALNDVLRKLQHDAICDPIWINDKGVFEYPEENVETVVILKLVRAVHGLNAMNLLCQSGLFIDMSAIWRCVNDCNNEIYFLLENYPNNSSNVEKFINEFFSKTIDNYLTTDEEPVPNKKILNAYARVISGRDQDEEVKQTIHRIYKTNSGYIHASYAHIMEVFGGTGPSFNLSGVPSQTQVSIRMEIVEAAKTTVVQAIAFVAQKFGKRDLYEAAMKCS